MRQIYSKGKKGTYVVNIPSFGDEGIGAGCPTGTAWLQDELGNWYSVSLSGISGSLASDNWEDVPDNWEIIPTHWEGVISGLEFYITPIPVTNQSVGMNANDFGFQIIMANDLYNYQVSVDSSGPSVVISQTPSSYESSKPFLFLQSITDGAYYYVGAKNTGGVITLEIDNNSRIDGRLVQPLN